MKTTDYYNFFIAVAEDYLVLEAEIPSESGGKKTETEHCKAIRSKRT